MLDTEGPDQPAHLRRLILAFAVRKQNHWILYDVKIENKYPDETAHVQDDGNPHILRMLEDTFSFDAARILAAR